MRNIYFVGTAGCGKSTMVGAFKEWLYENGIDSITINLDPGVDQLPYEPDIDIREWVTLDEVMEEYALGPNGAQVAASDIMAMNITKITSILNTIKTKYVLIDTPGQLELFAFRASTKAIIDSLDKEKSMIAYLCDPSLCKTPNGYISSMVLSAIVQFRLQLPTITLLSKSDTLNEETLERTMSWYNNPDSLFGDLIDEDSDPQTMIGMELFKALENVGTYGEMRAISSNDFLGLEDIYSMAQLVFFGGEDADKD